MPEIADPTILEQIITLLTRGQNFALGLLQPWRMYQVVALAALFIAAHLLALFVVPRTTEWMRSLKGWPTWRMRILVLLNRRTRGIVFVILAWTTILFMREVPWTATWPSRSYLISLVATLATAWLVVSILTRLIRNRSLRKIISWGAWSFVTLQILNLLPITASFLDAVAIQFGAVRLSLLLVLKAIVTIAVLMILARSISGAAARRIERNEDISPSMQVLSVKLLQLGLYGAAVVISLQSIGFDMTTLTVLSGAIGLGLGFGLQKVVSNLVSGVILLLDKSIKPGDVISLGETFGWISSLGARYVSVLTRNGTEYLIPNEDLITNQVVNWSHSSDLVRLDIHFGVAYSSDPHQVKRLCSEAPLRVNRVINNPAPVCHVEKLGDSSIDFILRFWIRDPTKGLTNVRGDVHLALWDVLKENDIEIPFPRRDVSIVSSPNSDMPELTD